MAGRRLGLHSGLRKRAAMRHLWILPAAASAAFSAFTVAVTIKEGPFGFLTEHARNGWGAQIFIDLVCAALVGLSFAVPVARRYGVRPWPWILATVALGSPALLAFAARILFARSRDEAARGGQSLG